LSAAIITAASEGAKNVLKKQRCHIALALRSSRSRRLTRAMEAALLPRNARISLRLVLDLHTSRKQTLDAEDN
tara:strand:+ start:455 stop:673 length:219 start_codon:yes stop_codon:yes gene_type:complete